MTNAVKWETIGGLITYLDDELDALANGGAEIGAVIDNTTERDMYMILELYVAVQGAARAADAKVYIYLLPSVDGVNYCFGSDTVAPPSSALVGTFDLDEDTAARYVTMLEVTNGENRFVILIPPTKFKLLVKNQTGQAFAATLNTLRYRTFNEEIQ